MNGTRNLEIEYDVKPCEVALLCEECRTGEMISQQSDTQDNIHICSACKREVSIPGGVKYPYIKYTRVNPHGDIFDE